MRRKAWKCNAGIALVNQCFGSMNEKQFLTIVHRLDDRPVGCVGILVDEPCCGLVSLCVLVIGSFIVMIDSRVVVKGGLAVVTMLALALPIADAYAKDIRWLREEQGNVNREQPRGRPEQWQQGNQQGTGAERRPERRMSPDERRQLRRDVRDAGREIYPSRR